MSAAPVHRATSTVAEVTVMVFASTPKSIASPAAGTTPPTHIAGSVQSPSPPAHRIVRPVEADEFAGPSGVARTGRAGAPSVADGPALGRRSLNVSSPTAGAIR